MKKEKIKKLEFTQEQILQMVMCIGMLYTEVKRNVKLQLGLTPTANLLLANTGMEIGEKGFKQAIEVAKQLSEQNGVKEDESRSTIGHS